MSHADLFDYKTIIDRDIAAHSDVLLERWQRDYGLETAQVFEAYLSVLSRGGKRLRGALGMWAYQYAGGSDDILAVHIARALEMVHAYLLVVDDIADEAHLRRGGLSAHKLLESYHSESKWFGKSHIFGQMQAMNAGLAGQHLVFQEIAEFAVNDSIKLEAIRELSAILSQTVAGQIADINHQVIRDIGEKEVLAMMQRKTAQYSFVSPLQFGVILAGKDWSDYDWMQQWAHNIGLSFQITDDILGVFGDEKQTGKSNLDDLREGKITLLIVRALDRTSEKEKDQLLSILGKPEIDTSDLEKVQTMLQDSGALSYAQGLAKTYSEKAFSALSNQNGVEFLEKITAAIVGRKS